MSALGPGSCVPGFPDLKFILKARKKRRKRSRRGGEEREKREERREEGDIPYCSRKHQVTSDPALAEQDNGPEILRAQSLKTTDMSPFKTKGTEGMMKLRTWNRRLAWTTHKPFSQRESPALETGAKECRQPSEDGENKQQQQKQKTNIGHTRASSRGPLFPSHKVGIMKNVTHSSHSINVPPVPQGGGNGAPLQNSHPTPCFQPSKTSTRFLTPPVVLTTTSVALRVKNNERTQVDSAATPQTQLIYWALSMSGHQVISFQLYPMSPGVQEAYFPTCGLPYLLYSLMIQGWGGYYELCEHSLGFLP